MRKTFDLVHDYYQKHNLLSRPHLKDLAGQAMGKYQLATDVKNFDGTYGDEFDLVCKTICAKQHDYGHDNIARFGVFGLLVRIHDKIARLENLERRNSPSNEPLQDTLLDIVGYVALCLMWVDGTFSLPLRIDIADALTVEAEALGLYDDERT